jgi:hypothetical protein
MSETIVFYIVFAPLIISLGLIVLFAFIERLF